MTNKNTRAQRAKTPEQRFKEKRQEGDGCWEWTSALGSKGYGIFWAGGSRRSVMAHRFAYELATGAIPPDGLLVMHSCDNPKCVNPAHLSLGDTLDNALDAKGKGRLAAGERNGGGGKLTAADAVHIFQSRDVMNGQKTADLYGVSRYLVNAIRRGEVWKSETGRAQRD